MLNSFDYRCLFKVSTVNRPGRAIMLIGVNDERKRKGKKRRRRRRRRRWFLELPAAKNEL